MQKNKKTVKKKIIEKVCQFILVFLTYFPDALKEVAKCSLAGQKQHNQGDKLYWDKNKSFDNEDAI